MTITYITNAWGLASSALYCVAACYIAWGIVKLSRRSW